MQGLSFHITTKKRHPSQGGVALGKSSIYN